MPSRALAAAVEHFYPFAEGHCIAPSALSKCQFAERSASATYLPAAGQSPHLQTMHWEAADQGPWFPPRTSEEARTSSTSLPLTAGSEAAPASPIMAPPCSGEQLSPSDAAAETQARQAWYEFSRGDEDLEIMFELNSDMGITLRHPESHAVAEPRPPSGGGRRGMKRRAEEAPEGGLMDSRMSVPSGGYDWSLAGLDMGQAPLFWQGGDGFHSDASGGDAVQTLGLLGARLRKDARRQLELTKT